MGLAQSEIITADVQTSLKAEKTQVNTNLLSLNVVSLDFIVKYLIFSVYEFIIASPSLATSDAEGWTFSTNCLFSLYSETVPVM